VIGMLNKKTYKNFNIILMGLFISFFCWAYSSHASESHDHETESHDHESESHDHEKRQLGSHEHGVSTLKIAFEGQNIQMELESPANDIIGFEHLPKNNQQKAEVNHALSLLQEPNGVFIFSSEANCKIKNNKAEFEVEKGEGATHAGFHVIWKIKCDHPKRLKNLETTFFKLFQNAKEIEVEIISGLGQEAIEWESSMTKIELPAS